MSGVRPRTQGYLGSLAALRDSSTALRITLVTLALLVVTTGAQPHAAAAPNALAPARPAAPSRPVADALLRGCGARPANAVPQPPAAHMVVPQPADAQRYPNAACTTIERTEHLNVCAFGADLDDAAGTIALVGDSHAGHWRAALESVAQAYGWRGLSMTHTGCPLSKAVRNLEPAGRFRRCVEWKRAVFAWFQRHPEVHGVRGGPVRWHGRHPTARSGQVRGRRARLYARVEGAPGHRRAHCGDPRLAEDGAGHRRLRRACHGRKGPPRATLRRAAPGCARPRSTRRRRSAP